MIERQGVNPICPATFILGQYTSHLVLLFQRLPGYAILYSNHVLLMMEVPSMSGMRVAVIALTAWAVLALVCAPAGAVTVVRVGVYDTPPLILLSEDGIP